MVKKLFLALLLMLAITNTAWAYDDNLDLRAERAADGSVTLWWNKDYTDGYTSNDGKTFDIQFKVKSGAWGSWTDLSAGQDIPISDGRYHDAKVGEMYPDTTIVYRIDGYKAYETIDVKPYEEKKPEDDEDSLGSDSGNSSGDDGYFSKIFKGEMSVTEAENNAGYLERFCAEIVMILPRFIDGVIGITDPMELIFNRDVDNSMNPIEGLHLFTFDDNWWAAIGWIYDALKKAVPFPLQIGIALIGVYIMFKTTDAQNKLTTKDYLGGVVLCVLLINFGEFLWQLLFGINQYFVELLYSTIAGRVGNQSLLDTLCRWDTASFGMACIAFISVLSFAILNWQYSLRRIMLSILLIMFPAVAVASIFPQTRGVATLWFKETSAQLFLQTGHAAAFAFMILLIAVGIDFWSLMAFLLGINTIAVLVRRIIGADTYGSGVGGMAGTMLGLGSIMALARIGQGMMGKKVSPGMDMLSQMPLAGASAGVGAGVAAGAAVGGGALGGIAKTAVAMGAGLGGGALAGMATGNPGMGLMAGGLAGTAAAGKFGQLNGFINDVRRESQATGQSFMGTAASKMGIFDKGQLFDGESSAQIGRNLMGGTGVLGTAGAVGGRVASGVARTANAFTPYGNMSGSYSVGQGLKQYRDGINTDIEKAQKLQQKLQPEREMAKFQLDKAKSTEFYPNPVERNLAIQDATANLQAIDGRIADAKITVLDGQYALSNDGTQKKILKLREAHENAEYGYGGVNGYDYK